MRIRMWCLYTVIQLTLVLFSSRNQITVAGSSASTCTIRVPPADFVTEFVHIDSFERIHEQANLLCTLHHLPAYKCGSILKQLRDTLDDMVSFKATEAMVNITIDHRLTYAVNLKPNLTSNDALLDDLVILPQKPIHDTIFSYCKGNLLEEVACAELEKGIRQFVVRDWGCQDVSSGQTSTSIDKVVEVHMASTGYESSIVENSLQVNEDNTNLTTIEVVVDSHIYQLSVRAGQDLNLVGTHFCWNYNISVADCPKILEYLQEKAILIASIPSPTPLVTINSPRRNALLPMSERVYIDLEWRTTSSDPVCVFIDFQLLPVYCGTIPVSDQLYAKFKEASVGPHVLLVTKALPTGWTAGDKTSLSLLAVQYFTIVQPRIKLRDLSTSVVEHQVYLSALLETTDFDLNDRYHRLCVRMDDSFECYQNSMLLIQSSSLYTSQFRLPLFHAVNGSHTLMFFLLNEYDKVFASLESPIEFNLTLERDVTPLVRDTAYFHDPPGISHHQPLFDCPLSQSYHWVCDLWRYEWGYYSQNGEDGVLQAIFDHIGVTSRFYVEFGTEDGKECNTRYLRQYQNWTGLLMDGRYEDLSINLHQEWVTPDNVNGLFSSYEVPKTLDLLSIDIDFHDYWILRAIDMTKFNPRVIVIEYNSHRPPNETTVVPYKMGATWDGKSNYFGVSVGALDHWARKFSYSLVYCESHGVNCFLIRDDVLQETTDSDNRVFRVSDVLRPIHVYRAPNFFGRGISYPNRVGEANDTWIRVGDDDS